MKLEASEPAPPLPEGIEVVEGGRDGPGLRIGVAVSRFNLPITRALLDGALEALAQLEVAADDITVAWVPGTFELPFAARLLARRCDAVLCLGSVIRGETSHYDHVSERAATGIGQAADDTGVPVIFGVLTTENAEQAWARVGLGAEGAADAVECARLVAALVVAGRASTGKG